MAAIKQFADTSAVSLAYAIDAAPDAQNVTATRMSYIPFTSEGFQMGKESQQSTAITNDRRPSGSKNTRGSASGSAGIEFGFVPFAMDMLQLAMMNKWRDITADDGEGNQVPTGEAFLIDGESREFFLVEKRIRNVVGGKQVNMFERYYGNMVNEASIEVGDAALVGMTVNTMGVFADLHRADAEEDENAGGLVSEYVVPDSYEIADASNNVKKAVIKDADGNPLEVTFSDFTLSINNNVREQAGVGHEFAAGMAMGKVNVQLSGTIYYYDDTVLKTHMENKYVSAEVTLETDEGTLVFHLPALKAEAPNTNAQGENQDYTQSLTLNAERGQVQIGGQEHTCVVAIVKKAAV